MFKLRMALLITALACSNASAQLQTRKYDDPGAPPFKVLKEGENPPLDAYDNFVIGPKYVPAPERKKVEGVPEGKVQQFEIDSKETKLFNPGIARKRVRQGRSEEPEDADRRDAHHRLQAQDRGLHSRPVQGGHRSAVHGRPRRPRPGQRLQDDPRQPDRPEADSADRPHRHRQRRRRRPGARARQGIRQHERRLRRRTSRPRCCRAWRRTAR